MDSAYSFSRAPQVNVPRSVFNLGHGLKTTIGTDYLYPIYAKEVLPGDTFDFSHNLFGRLTTPLTPLMDELYLDTFFFYVPIRLIDKNFKKLMGESPVGLPDNNVTVPKISTGAAGAWFNTIYDYFGIPPGVTNLSFCPWKMRAYNYIYNDWFRDANIISPEPVHGSFDYPPADDAIEDISTYKLLKRAKRLDYFTGALPWPQRGPDTYLPMGTSAPVVGTGRGLGITNFSDPSKTGQSRIGYLYSRGDDGTVHARGYGSDNTEYDNPNFRVPWVGSVRSESDSIMRGDYVMGVSERSYLSNIFADLTSATAITINQFREAVAVQHLYEAFARGGSNRYIEILRSTFNIVSPDARLQRSEYLGGSSTRMDVTTVAQTSSSTETSPLGNLAAFVTVNSNAHFKKSFTEHGLIIGLANVRAELSYSQGLSRDFSRTTRLDFYWPQLANLGEQAIYNREIYAQGNDQDNYTFGYQERWAEYRYHPNQITGTFRPTHPQSLDVWHLSQEFSSLPVLNRSFIEESVPIERVVAVTDEPPVMLWGEFKIKAARPIPLYSVPGLNRL